MIPLTWRNLFMVYSYYHCYCPTIFILQFWFMFPLFFWNVFTTSCYHHCSSISMFVLYIRTMIPLFWRNNTISSEKHSYSTIIRNNIWIMIIFLIWNLFIFPCLYHSFCHDIFSSFRVSILLILPIIWYFYSIIP